MSPENRTASRRRRGFTLIELLIVIAIILTIITFAVIKAPAVLNHVREVMAIRHLQTINTAQTQYQSQFGKFATKLDELGPPTGGAAGPAAADLIPEDLAKGTKSGYKFVLQGDGNKYTVNADPISFGTTGRRTFYSDQSQGIRENWGQDPATTNSPLIK